MPLVTSSAAGRAAIQTAVDMTKNIVLDDYTKRKPPLTSQSRRPKRPKVPSNGIPKQRTCKPAQQAPRRYWLDIGKNLSLALTAAKYDFDPRLDADQVDGGAA